MADVFYMRYVFALTYVLILLGSAQAQSVIDIGETARAFVRRQRQRQSKGRVGRRPVCNYQGKERDRGWKLARRRLLDAMCRPASARRGPSSPYLSQIITFAPLRDRD
jgi:hypothetical protein